MNNFEQQYYESESFWENGMVGDSFNSKRILSTINLLPKDIRSLADIGCGNGVFINQLLLIRPDLDLVGVDRSRTALKMVQSKKFEAEINDLPFRNGEFECITCLEVLEHIPVSVYKDSLDELSRISSRYVVISVPFDEKLEDAYTKCPQCKTTFNRDLHLRSFNEETMRHLLDKQGFACKQIVKEGFTQKYVGHDLFRKVFYPEQFTSWDSPICPVCGYTSKEPRSINTNITGTKTNEKKKLVKYLTRIPKMIWPKKGKHYWIIALYEKHK